MGLLNNLNMTIFKLNTRKEIQNFLKSHYKNMSYSNDFIVSWIQKLKNFSIIKEITNALEIVLVNTSVLS
jgi:hypothetical protein